MPLPSQTDVIPSKVASIGSSERWKRVQNGAMHQPSGLGHGKIVVAGKGSVTKTCVDHGSTSSSSSSMTHSPGTEP